ncbi:OmpA family protein [Trinickia caryophylli]|uniref:OmpA family protein n=1 Tax=Trinickia caryophylli TaxID=28094 RepID=A0A1X7G1T9_TRICW|nr:OmpA family protein [Trinickia caryophylli]
MPATPVTSLDDTHASLGYPFKSMLAFAALLAFVLIWAVLPLARTAAWILTAGIALVGLALAGWHMRQLAHARNSNAKIFAALGPATADIPVNLRTRMPLVLVTGDGLGALFDRDGETRYAHVGEGAIWLRVDRPEDLPRLALAIEQWRDGRAPDGIVLSVAPALHTSADALSQSLRIARQAAADASSRLGAKLPAYVAVYQRLTAGPAALSTPQWYGVSSATRIADTGRFEWAIQAAENEVQRATGERLAAVRAAALASVVGWTQRVVIGALTDHPQPAPAWPLFGAAWIDCGPASGANNPWQRDVEMQTEVMRANAGASPLPWPLPQPLIEAMPVRRWISPRIAALAHALIFVALASATAFWGAARNNRTLVDGIATDLMRYFAIPAARDTARRDALKTLMADRDLLDRYARTGVPTRLSFGMYRGAQLMPVLDHAIASYAPPPAPPAVVTLDSMSLFDSGKAKLKPGSTRAMVEALEMIKAHPEKRILVAGHTDNAGTPENNLKLSIARAGAIRDWLIDASGIPATQFAIQGYGDTRPIAGNETADGRARNRRVEITLIPDEANNRLPVETDSSRENAPSERIAH